MTIGEKILKLRKARGWNQEELAEQVGVSRQAVSRWESDSAKPDADKIVAICDLFGVSADYLLRENYQGESEKGSTQPQPQSTTLTSVIRGLSMSQWISVFLLLGGLAVMLLMKLVYIFVDTNYYYQDIMGVNYTGFQGFLRAEEMLWFWRGGMIATVLGAVRLIPVPEKIRIWFHDGWEDLKSRFDFF